MKQLFLTLLITNIVLMGKTIVPQTDIYFGNGIYTTEKEANDDLTDILKPAILHEIYNDNEKKMERMHRFAVAYNYSFKDFGVSGVRKLGSAGIVLDIMESYEQLKSTSLGWKTMTYVIKGLDLFFLKGKPWGYAAKKQFMDYLIDKGINKEFATYIAMEVEADDFKKLKILKDYFKEKIINYAHDRDLEKIKVQYNKSISKGHGVILVSHSQGNLFSLEASDEISENKDDWIYHVSIASPGTDTASKNHWIVAYDNDGVANIGTVNIGHKLTNEIRYYTHRATNVIPDTRTYYQIELINNPPQSKKSPGGYWLYPNKPIDYTIKTTYYDPELQITQEYIFDVTADDAKYTHVGFHYFSYYMGYKQNNVFLETHQTADTLASFYIDPMTYQYKSKSHIKIINGIKEAISMHKLRVNQGGNDTDDNNTGDNDDNNTGGDSDNGTGADNGNGSDNGDNNATDPTKDPNKVCVSNFFDYGNGEIIEDLKKGDKDEQSYSDGTKHQVKELQKFLEAFGYDVGTNGADGWFGTDTKNALINFQSNNGLDADGIVGPNTRKAMNSQNCYDK